MAAARSPSLRDGVGATGASASSRASAAWSSAPFGPAAKVAPSASRPRSAAQVSRATTATPLGTSTTASTPGTFSAFLRSKPATAPPTTGGRATAAKRSPGSRTSQPKTARPVVLAGRSRRGTRLPMSLKASGALSGGSAGTSSLLAAAASAP